jgi:hypothetical protein
LLNKSIPNPFYLHFLFYIFKKHNFYFTNSFLHNTPRSILYFTIHPIKIINIYIYTYIYIYIYIYIYFFSFFHASPNHTSRQHQPTAPLHNPHPPPPQSHSAATQLSPQPPLRRYKTNCATLHSNTNPIAPLHNPHSHSPPEWRRKRTLREREEINESGDESLSYNIPERNK